MLSSYLTDFVSLFYPRYCDGCKRTLLKDEKYLCNYCLSNLPKTNFHTQKNNPVEMVFAGRIPVFRAAAFCFFKQENSMQNIVHQLKYKGNKEIGVYLGHLFGLDLIKDEDFETVDVILPIPLHAKKLKKRGYNQSEYIAKGMAEAMSKPIDTTSLIRVVETSTQTKKARYARWENTSGIFQLTAPEKLTGKHILLVDDIITTGATIESAAQQLMHLEEIKISVVSLGVAT
jgi:ComF family protein